MNFKNKLRVTKSLAVIISLVSITVLSIFFQGCQEEYTIPTEDLSYLELNSSIENMSSADYEILKQAKERLSEYISSDKGKFVLEIKSGEQVNISDELFEYFKYSISNANNILRRDNEYKINGDKIIKRREFKLLRLKSGILEGDDGKNYVSHSGIDFTWYGMDLNVAHDDVVGLQAGTFGLSYILSKYKTGDPIIDSWIESTEAISFFTGLLSSVWDQGKGFTIICPLYFPTYAITY